MNKTLSKNSANPGHPLVEVAGDLFLRPMRLPAFHRQQEDFSIISVNDILLLHFQNAILPVRTLLPFDVPKLQEFVLHLLTSLLRHLKTIHRGQRGRVGKWNGNENTKDVQVTFRLANMSWGECPMVKSSPGITRWECQPLLEHPMFTRQGKQQSISRLLLGCICRIRPNKSSQVPQFSFWANPVSSD